MNKEDKWHNYVAMDYIDMGFQFPLTTLDHQSSTFPMNRQQGSQMAQEC